MFEKKFANTQKYDLHVSRSFLFIDNFVKSKQTMFLFSRSKLITRCYVVPSFENKFSPFHLLFTLVIVVSSIISIDVEQLILKSAFLFYVCLGKINTFLLFIFFKIYVSTKNSMNILHSLQIFLSFYWKLFK